LSIRVTRGGIEVTPVLARRDDVQWQFGSVRSLDRLASSKVTRLTSNLAGRRGARSCSRIQGPSGADLITLQARASNEKGKGHRVRTSNELQLGQIYSRDQLRERFDIEDKTLYTGMFKPPAHDSLWLFVTEEKTEGMTGYQDRLDGDVLYWQGQTAGAKDSQIIEHGRRGLELLLFYRPRKDSYPNHGFRFEGQFEYVSHTGGRPTDFVLRRVATARVRRISGPTVTPSTHGQETTCLVDVMGRLRQSGRESVVAERSLTDMQRRMHVPDAIEDWVAQRITAWRRDGRRGPLLIVLSGNAGDGKSDLIERLRARADVVSDDTDVVADATHADSPSQSQAERLVEKLALFVNEPLAPPVSARCVLIAMNVGMVIAFFDALSGGEQEGRFSRLGHVLRRRLGLTRDYAEPPEHWDCEVVNLDHRNLLGRDDDGLFAGMLRKLDPEEPKSLTYSAAEACRTCPARGSCWVRTNLNVLRLPAVRRALHELLWEATLGTDLHLSPRNAWDFLSQVTTGGMELPTQVGNGQFLSCDWIRENLPASAQELNSTQLTLVHRRLIYHLIFESPSPTMPSRGPLLNALAAADPIRRGGKHAHLAESEVRATPKADSEQLSTLALQADEPADAGDRRPDPLLDGLASLATDPILWYEPDRQNASDLALGVSRRARLTGLQNEIQAEVSDEDARQFLTLLHDYSTWHRGQKPPSLVRDFWLSALVGGVRNIFGVEVQGETYFRLDTLSPSTRFPAYVPVNLKQKLSIKPDPVSDYGAAWLDAVAYLPRTVTATIDTGGEEPWEVPVDLQLFRLLSKVNRGYSASSVDLETFFRLRYACERLGATDATGEIVFRALDSGKVSRLEREQQLGGWETTSFGPVEK
jgi:hypothetical protein